MDSNNNKTRFKVGDVIDVTSTAFMKDGVRLVLTARIDRLRGSTVEGIYLNVPSEGLHVRTGGPMCLSLLADDGRSIQLNEASKVKQILEKYDIQNP